MQLNPYLNKPRSETVYNLRCGHSYNLYPCFSVSLQWFRHSLLAHLGGRRVHVTVDVHGRLGGHAVAVEMHGESVLQLAVHRLEAALDRVAATDRLELDQDTACKRSQNTL